MAWSKPVRRVLLAAVASPPRDEEIRSTAATFDDAAWNELAAAAHTHGIGGYVGQAVHAVQPPPANAAADFLRKVPLRNVTRHMQTVADLHGLAATLGAVNVDWLVVKGPVLAETVHDSAALRSYGDLDVLVRPRQLGDALDALESAGARIVDRNWLLLHRELKGEVRIELPLGTTLDLHWHLLNSPALRRRFRLSSNDLLDRSRVVAVSGREIPTLNKADTVVYVALHATLSGLHRLVWLKDVELVTQADDLAWDDAVVTARAWQAQLPLAVALAEVQRTLGTRLLGGVPQLQASTTWRGACAVANRISPVAAADGSGSILRLISRATRDRLSSSIGESLRRSSGFLRDTVRRTEAVRGDDGRLRDDQPGSGRYDAGGTEGRRAFIEAVGNAER